MIFLLLPEVVIAITVSLFFPRASICLENINLKLKSLPIAVRAEVSVVSAKAAIAFLFFLYLTVSYVARCCASAALPPFPNKSILPPLFNEFKEFSHNFKKFSFFDKKIFLVIKFNSFISFFKILFTKIIFFIVKII